MATPESTRTTANPVRNALGGLRRLLRSRSGTSAVEFALVLPVMVSLGMYGTEIAYMASINMQVSQLALSVADNASRLGQTDNSAVTPTVTEADINSIMTGAVLQGESFGFQTKGRIILSSLERDAASSRQYIHWQRCVGGFNRASDYGNDSNRNGLTGAPLGGMGRGTNTITASSSTAAVMYVEVFYQYEGIFGDLFVDNMVFKQEAAFLIRDDRNLTPGVTGTGGTATCS